MKPFLVLVLFLLRFSPDNAVQADIIEDLSTQFRLGNAKEIAKNFAPSVELIIIDQEDVYSKAQSEQILKDFFVKNPPTKSTIIHRLNNNPNFRFSILSLTTKTSKFRVTITMMLSKATNAFLIKELKIEQDKD